MKKLLTSSTLDSLQVSILKELLEEEGISCTIKNESLSAALGEMFFTECYPDLWILNDADYPKAKDIHDAYLNSPKSVAYSWTCKGCGEIIEPQFTSCWKCGRQQEKT